LGIAKPAPSRQPAGRGQTIDAAHPVVRPVPDAHNRPWWVLTITALGVVYGDIGTSPLYAFQVALQATGEAVVRPLAVMGIVSLIVWALIIIVALKYVVLVLRADNEGEGGILALLSLVIPARRPLGGGIPFLMFLGMLGAALLYGDGLITPAISVLSAMEGLKVATPGLEQWIVPLTCAILVGLFLIQSRGTGRIGQFFGPVMILWFVAIGLLGIHGIAQSPGILLAIDPRHAARFLAADPMVSFGVFGSVFLALTGAEALYADMGHVGAPAIRRAWFGIVLPALLLCYFGQGALVLAHPDAADNPFYKLAPAWASLPLVALAAAATIIASQALISGAFSMTRQAIQMRLCPRLAVKQTSRQEAGQIYIGTVNWALMIGTLLIVLTFRSSDHLASAYGIAVSGTMLITTILLFRVLVDRWRWSLPAALSVIVPFAAIDATFLAANSLKILEGGWLPLAVGGGIVFLMAAWNRGSVAVQRRLQENGLPLSDFIATIDDRVATRIPGCGVFLARASDTTSPFLLTHVAHNRVLHENVILLTVEPTARPIVPPGDRLEIKDLGHGFHRVFVRIGFMETVDVPAAMQACAQLGMNFCGYVNYYVPREMLIRRIERPILSTPVWLVFHFMSRNALHLSDYLRLPPPQVMEVGLQIDI